MGVPTPPGLDFSAFLIDSHGNVADYELFASSFTSTVAGGLLTLDRVFRRKHRELEERKLAPWRGGAEAIAVARKRMEAAFRQLGDGLDSLLTTSRSKVQGSRESVMDRMGSVADHSHTTMSQLTGAADLCRRALRFGDEGTELTSIIRADLDELEDLSLRIHRMETQIADHMRPAGVVQVLLKIECARLDEVARAPLEALGAEIARTCGKMSDAMEAEFELVEQTHQSVQLMIRHVKYLEQSARDAERRRAELNLEMAAVEKRAQEQAERDREIGAIAERLDLAIGKLIESMQFQDIVGQRWDHIQDGFERLDAHMLPHAERALQARLQQAQLIEANTEMADALGGIATSFAIVEEAEQELRAHVDRMVADKGRQELNVKMHAILFEAWDMATANQKEMQETDALILPLVQVAGKMGCLIGDVSHEMRMIALNSQIQAARFGAMTGLETLAEALRHIADEMGDGGSRLDGDSRQIEQVAQDLRDCFGTLSIQATRICDECREAIPKAVDQLVKQENDCNRLLEQTSAGLQQVRLILGQMNVSLEQALHPLEAMGDLAQACGSFVEEFYRRDSVMEGAARDQLLASESSHYTMASEKQVLLQVASGRAAAPVAELESEPEAGPEQRKQSGTGEVELF